MHSARAAVDPALFHVACPFTGEAQCYCPHGSSLATGQQQGASAKQLYAAWRDRIPHLQAQYGAMRSQPSPGMSAGSTELLMPRLYRNPKSMEANNDLPVNAGGEMISKNQAVARLSKALAEAKALVSGAAELAIAAGQTFDAPPELEVDMSRLQPPKDLAILRRIAAGAVVERAKRGELSDAEERQLLGLSEEEYRALRTAPAPSMAGQPPQHGMPQPASQARGTPPAGPGREDGGPGADGVHTLRMREIKSSLRGKTILVKLPQTSTWQRAMVHAVDLKNRTAKLGLTNASGLMDVDLSQAIRERLLAWDGERPQADRPPSDGGDAQRGMPYPAAMEGAPQPQPQPQQQVNPQQQQMMAMMHGKPAQAQVGGFQGQQQQQQQQGSMVPQQPQPQGVGMHGGYSAGSPAMPRAQHGGEQYQQRAQRSMMEALLSMGQQAVGYTVEVQSPSSQQSRKGVIGMVVPQQGAIVVQFGPTSVALKASDEFRTFTIRVVQDPSGMR
eukprot:jgi/Tetstr1/448513/TSEL_035778.t1